MYSINAKNNIPQLLSWQNSRPQIQQNQNKMPVAATKIFRTGFFCLVFCKLQRPQAFSFFPSLLLNN